MHFADNDKKRGILQLHDRYRTGNMLGAHMCSAPHFRTEKSLWEHYNDLASKLDATQEAVWHDTANTILTFVRLPSSLSILSPASKI